MGNAKQYRMETDTKLKIRRLQARLKDDNPLYGKEFKERLYDINSDNPENLAKIKFAVKDIPDTVLLNSKMRRKIRKNKVLKYLIWKNC